MFLLTLHSCGSHEEDLRCFDFEHSRPLTEYTDPFLQIVVFFDSSTIQRCIICLNKDILSRLEAHNGFFRLPVKGKFDVYLM